MKTRYARTTDLDLIKKFDSQLSANELDDQIMDKRVLVATAQSGYAVAAWLRFEIFRHRIPYMNMLYVLEEYRGKEYGRRLIEEWEARMKRLDYKAVMTSVKADSQSQHFFRKIGYSDAGAFIADGENYELVFTKSLYGKSPETV